MLWIRMRQLRKTRISQSRVLPSQSWQRVHGSSVHALGKGGESWVREVKQTWFRDDSRLKVKCCPVWRRGGHRAARRAVAESGWCFSGPSVRPSGQEGVDPEVFRFFHCTLCWKAGEFYARVSLLCLKSKKDLTPTVTEMHPFASHPKCPKYFQTLKESRSCGFGVDSLTTPLMHPFHPLFSQLSWALIGCTWSLDSFLIN